MNAARSAALLAALFFVTAARADAPPPTATAPTDPPEAPCDADAGPCAQPLVKQTFDAKCAGCHGVDGKAKTKYGKRHGIPNFATKKWQKEIDDAEIGQKIREGVIDHGKRVMPAFKDKLAVEQMAALTVYVRGLKP